MALIKPHHGDPLPDPARQPENQLVWPVQEFAPDPSLTYQLPANGWRPRPYQTRTWNYFERGGKRAAVVLHRRAGKDLLGINLCAVKMMERPGLYWHCFPKYAQGRKVIWDGFTKSGKRFLDSFPKPLIKSINNQMMRVELHNGAIYQVVGTDDPNDLVGANPFGIIFSEWSLCHPRAWTFTRPILRENGGWALFIFTPRGQNHGWEMLKLAKERAAEGKDWHYEHLGVGDTEKSIRAWADQATDPQEKAMRLTHVPVTEEDIEDERKEGMSEEMIQQEYYVSFESALSGSYFGRIIKTLEANGHIDKAALDNRLVLNTAWDLGINDETVIWFFQQVGNEYHIVDCYYNSGEGIQHYVNVVNEKMKGYAEGKHYMPHDVEALEYGSGMTRYEKFKQLGLKPKTVPRQKVEDGIEAVRSVLPRCYFNKATCEVGIRALKEYTKTWDEKRRCYAQEPYHDWTSHFADSFRTLAMGVKDQGLLGKKAKPQQYAEGDFNPYKTTY